MGQKDPEAVVAYVEHLRTYIYIVSTANGWSDMLSQREVPHLCRQEIPGLSVFAGLFHYNFAFCNIGAGQWLRMGIQEASDVLCRPYWRTCATACLRELPNLHFEEHSRPVTISSNIAAEERETISLQ